MPSILMALMALDIGGAETHVVELSKELARRGWTVCVASNGGVYTAELEKCGIKHYKVPLHSKNPKCMLASYRLLKRIIAEEKPDIVHAHARIPGFILGRLHKKLGFPFVTTAHGMFETGRGLKYLTDWGERTIAVSGDIKKYLIDNYHLTEDKITVTINGIDTERFSPDNTGEGIKREFGLSEGGFTIVYISRMDEDKSMVAHMLTEVCGELSAEIEGLRVLIVGGGDDFESVSAGAKQMNTRLDREAVIATGGRTDIADIIAAGDMTVGVSRAALESMSCGKPVIIADNDGYIGVMEESIYEASRATNFCRGTSEMTRDKLIGGIRRIYRMSDEEKARMSAYLRGVILDNYSVGRMCDDAESVYKSVKKS